MSQAQAEVATVPLKLPNIRVALKISGQERNAKAKCIEIEDIFKDVVSADCPVSNICRTIQTNYVPRAKHTDIRLLCQGVELLQERMLSDYLAKLESAASAGVPLVAKISLGTVDAQVPHDTRSPPQPGSSCHVNDLNKLCTFLRGKTKEFLKEFFSENAVRDSIEGTEVYRHAVLEEPLMFPPEPDVPQENCIPLCIQQLSSLRIEKEKCVKRRQKLNQHELDIQKYALDHGKVLPLNLSRRFPQLFPADQYPYDGEQRAGRPANPARTYSENLHHKLHDMLMFDVAELRLDGKPYKGGTQVPKRDLKKDDDAAPNAANFKKSFKAALQKRNPASRRGGETIELAQVLEIGKNSFQSVEPNILADLAATVPDGELDEAMFLEFMKKLQTAHLSSIDANLKCVLSNVKGLNFQTLEGHLQQALKATQALLNPLHSEDCWFSKENAYYNLEDIMYSWRNTKAKITPQPLSFLCKLEFAKEVAKKKGSGTIDMTQFKKIIKDEFANVVNADKYASLLGWIEKHPDEVINETRFLELINELQPNYGVRDVVDFYDKLVKIEDERNRLGKPSKLEFFIAAKDEKSIDMHRVLYQLQREAIHREKIRDDAGNVLDLFEHKLVFDGQIQVRCASMSSDDNLRSSFSKAIGKINELQLANEVRLKEISANVSILSAFLYTLARAKMHDNQKVCDPEVEATSSLGLAGIKQFKNYISDATFKAESDAFRDLGISEDQMRANPRTMFEILNPPPPPRPDQSPLPKFKDPDTDIYQTRAEFRELCFSSFSEFKDADMDYANFMREPFRRLKKFQAPMRNPPQVNFAEPADPNSNTFTVATFNLLAPKLDLLPYFETRFDPDTFLKQSRQHKGRSFPPLSQRTSSSVSWEARLPKIAQMISGFDADFVCLQEVQCSNASVAELKPEPLIGRIKDGLTEEKKNERQALADSLRDRVKSLISPRCMSENPENVISVLSEQKKLSAVLHKNSKILEPAEIGTKSVMKHLTMFYENPSSQNVKAVIVKKIKIPIFAYPEPSDPNGNLQQQEKLQPSQENQELLQKLKKTSLENQELLQEKRGLLQKTKWLTSVAFSEKPVEQRRRDILRDSNGFKTVGCQYFLLVVIKAGTISVGCELDYVQPGLPIYNQERHCVKVESIVDFNNGDGSNVKDGGKVACVESISVKYADLESIALLQVSKDHFTKVQDMVVQREDDTSSKTATKATLPAKGVSESESGAAASKAKKVWTGSKKLSATGFLYSKDAYAVEQELKSLNEDCLNEIMNFPLLRAQDRRNAEVVGKAKVVGKKAGGGMLQRAESSSAQSTASESLSVNQPDAEKTLGHVYDVVYLANCQTYKDKNSKVPDEPEVKRLSSKSSKIVSTTYGIAILYKREKFMPDKSHADLIHVFDVSPSLSVPSLNQPFWYRRPLNRIITKAFEDSSSEDCKHLLDVNSSQQSGAIVLPLLHRVTRMPIVIVNTHIACKFLEPTFQLAQASLLMKEITRLREYQPQLPIVVCGDMNSGRKSLLREYMLHGMPAKQDENDELVIPADGPFSDVWRREFNKKIEKENREKEKSVEKVAKKEKAAPTAGGKVAKFTGDDGDGKVAKFYDGDGKVADKTGTAGASKAPPNWTVDCYPWQRLWFKTGENEALFPSEHRHLVALGDAFQHLHEDVSSFTVPGEKTSSGENMVLDHIFYTPSEMRPILDDASTIVPRIKFTPEAAPNKVVPSDHCPLVMTFQFTTTEEGASSTAQGPRRLRSADAAFSSSGTTPRAASASGTTPRAASASGATPRASVSFSAEFSDVAGGLRDCLTKWSDEDWLLSSVSSSERREVLVQQLSSLFANFYPADASAKDKFKKTNDLLLMVFPAGKPGAAAKPSVEEKNAAKEASAKRTAILQFLGLDRTQKK